ncbi:hypothetical protein SDC9_206020 [bioreactor metagenome]|uniref:Uncharacterized protein n=1 Tax=bioreactor metagenome TaxID=1076179 RepID=A0A645J4E3_9ZZZZ
MRVGKQIAKIIAQDDRDGVHIHGGEAVEQPLHERFAEKRFCGHADENETGDTQFA